MNGNQEAWTPHREFIDMFLLTFEHLAFHIFNNKTCYLEMSLYRNVFTNSNQYGCITS